MRRHSWDVKLAIVNVFDNAPTTERAANNESPVDASGSNAESSEPKTKSSTMNAAAIPNMVPLEDEGFVEAAISPRTSTWRPWPFAARAVLTNLVAAVELTLLASLLKLIVANATWPLRLNCFAPAAV